MKTVDLNFDIKDIDGVDLANGHAGRIVGNAMLSQAAGDPLKYYNWAISLGKKESLSLDDSDYSNIKEFVRSTNLLNILVKAQVLKALSE